LKENDQSVKENDQSANVNLRIERLVLEGFSLRPGEHRVVRAAAEAELSRLFSEGGVSAAMLSGGAVPRLSADDISVAGDADAGALGRQIARAVYGGIGR
jgi:hypothetical protein